MLCIQKFYRELHHSKRDWPTEEDLREKISCDGTTNHNTQHTTDRHRDLETESAQWADAVNIHA